MNTVQLTLQFDDSSKESVKISDVADTAVPDVKDKIQALNVSLTGGTAGTVPSVIVSKTGYELVLIESAKIIATTDTEINIVRT